MAKIFNRALGICGEPRTFGGVSFIVTEYDASGLVKTCKGSTIPTNGTAGFAVGSIWTDTDGGVGATFYINEGTTTSCDFNEVGSGAQGPTGPTGVSGVSGVSGVTGATGADSTVTGPTGPTGTPAWETVTIGLTGSSQTGRSSAYTTGSTIQGYYISSMTGYPNPSVTTLVKSNLALNATLSVVPGGTDAYTISVIMLLA